MNKKSNQNRPTARTTNKPSKKKTKKENKFQKMKPPTSWGLKQSAMALQSHLAKPSHPTCKALPGRGESKLCKLKYPLALLLLRVGRRGKPNLCFPAKFVAKFCTSPSEAIIVIILIGRWFCGGALRELRFFFDIVFFAQLERIFGKCNLVFRLGWDYLMRKLINEVELARS